MPPAKVRRMEEETSRLQDSLKSFELDRILNESGVSKMIILLGRFKGKEGQAIIILSRRHFPVNPTACSALVADLSLRESFTNDIYSKFEGQLGAEDSAINVDIIYPCTEKHISKYSAQQTLMLTETPDVYNAVTLPYILSIPKSAIQWVYNVLDKSKEAERLLFEDPDDDIGFILQPDMKWDQSQVEALYCLAIVHRKDLRTLRDLRAEHIPLLDNIRSRGCAAIEERFGISRDKLRIYIHYIPSYFHLHVHFIHAHHDASFGMAVGKGHALDEVISALQIDSEYFTKVVLSVALPESLAAKYKVYLESIERS